MNVDEAWSLMGEAAEFPREAVQWSLDHWDEVSARYLAKLRAAANGAAMSETDYEALFCVVHMFAEKFDTRAYVPLCELMVADYELETWLGDAITETLPGVLINLFDGDVGPLKRAIEFAGRRRFRALRGAERAGLSRARKRRPQRRGHARLSRQARAGGVAARTSYDLGDLGVFDRPTRL